MHAHPALAGPRHLNERPQRNNASTPLGGLGFGHAICSQTNIRLTRRGSRIILNISRIRIMKYACCRPFHQVLLGKHRLVIIFS